MKPWTLAIVFVLLFVSLRLSASPHVLSAEETDALAGSFRLADRLTDSDTPLGERLRQGFATPASHPKLAHPDRFGPRHAAVAQPPLPLWLGTLGMMSGVQPNARTHLAQTGTSSALAFAMALTLLLWLYWRQDPVLAAVIVVTLPLLPTALDAAGAAGYGAAAVLAMSLLVAAQRRLTQGRGWGWPVGLAFGLTLAVHPAAMALLLAVFASYAVSRPAEAGPAPEDGAAPLPFAPLGLYLAPLLGLIVLCALWPSLWDDTTKHLGSWLVDTFSMKAPDQVILGHVYSQASDRAPTAWTALVQWVSWSTPPVIAAWALGVVRTVRNGRSGDWFPIMAVGALLLVGAVDGGLFNGRLSLLQLLWVPTAVTAAHGIIEIARFFARRWRVAPHVAATLASALILSIPALGILAGEPAAPLRGIGSEARWPLPIPLLTEIASIEPGAPVHVSSAPAGWRPAVEAARKQLGVDVVWSKRETAHWVISAGEEQAHQEPAAARRLERPAWGVRLTARQIAGRGD